MALTRSITSLITDEGTGHARKDFLASNAEVWAQTHMAQRYGASAPLESDGLNHISRLCYEYLQDEYRALRGWFTDEGKLSPLLQSKFLSTRLSGPLGDGIGWDFKQNGDPEPQMLQFKGTLISATRSAELLPVDARNSGNMAFGGIVRLVRTAYTARAAMHSWRAIMKKAPEGHEEVDVDGAELSRRWVAFRTYNFMVELGAEPVWAWEASRCKSSLGAVDEEYGKH